MRRRRTPRQPHAEGLVAQRADDAAAPVGRGVAYQPRQIGDALGGGEAADGAHRLFAVGGVEPGADGVRDDQPDEQDQQGLAEQAPRPQALDERTAHCAVTSGVNM
jgi:hypothetical protein